jgi:hypothetical protein
MALMQGLDEMGSRLTFGEGAPQTTRYLLSLQQPATTYSMLLSRGIRINLQDEWAELCLNLTRHNQ